MSITSKSRALARRGVTIQRRVAITQALFWPVLLGVVTLIGTAALLTRRRGNRHLPTTRVGSGETRPLNGHADTTAGLEPAVD